MWVCRRFPNSIHQIIWNTHKTPQCFSLTFIFSYPSAPYPRNAPRCKTCLAVLVMCKVHIEFYYICKSWLRGYPLRQLQHGSGAPCTSKSATGFGFTYHLPSLLGARDSTRFFVSQIVMSWKEATKVSEIQIDRLKGRSLSSSPHWTSTDVRLRKNAIIRECAYQLWGCNSGQAFNFLLWHTDWMEN